jgi:predicted PilT family ATPase
LHKEDNILLNDVTCICLLLAVSQLNGGVYICFELNNKLHVFCYQQVKILVPNSTAGMIIGKSGNYIKQIKEESGAYIQISQKSKEINLPERCVTIAGKNKS